MSKLEDERQLAPQSPVGGIIGVNRIVGDLQLKIDRQLAQSQDLADSAAPPAASEVGQNLRASFS
jgi:hypothetical protein